MRFNNTLLTALTSAGLVSAVALPDADRDANLTVKNRNDEGKVPTRGLLRARGDAKITDDDLDDLDIDDDTWEKYSSFCSTSSPSKRTIFSRETQQSPAGTPIPDGFESRHWVLYGKHDGEWQGVTSANPWTSMLVSCFGLTIIGDVKLPDHEDRVLAHFLATQDNIKMLWDMVMDTAKHTDNKRAYLSVPDLENGLPDSWDDSLTDMSKKLQDLLSSKIKEFTGKAPWVATHNMMEAANLQNWQGYMTVKDQRVTINNVDVTDNL
ncbi:hypothetical protein F5Y19DRAFT_488994 [Xylariaceae sp. FL1651]|nr:hypothetical protein F5Y19DRAFT_488994 [Xylariaceae sp. FL1651]